MQSGLKLHMYEINKISCASRQIKGCFLFYVTDTQIVNSKLKYNAAIFVTLACYNVTCTDDVTITLLFDRDCK